MIAGRWLVVVVAGCGLVGAACGDDDGSDASDRRVEAEQAAQLCRDHESVAGAGAHTTGYQMLDAGQAARLAQDIAGQDGEPWVGLPADQPVARCTYQADAGRVFVLVAASGEHRDLPPDFEERMKARFDEVESQITTSSSVG